MRYEAIDPIIDNWAKENEIGIQKDFKGEEVRTTNVFGPGNKDYQIWIDVPSDDNVGVHVWDYKKKREDYLVPISELSNTLDKALNIINEWGEE